MLNTFTPALVYVDDVSATRAALNLAISELQDQIDRAYDVAEGPSSFPTDAFNYAVNALEALDRQLEAHQEKAA